MGFHAVTRPSTREDLSIEDQLATNVGLILTKRVKDRLISFPRARGMDRQAQGFGILKWKHVSTQKIQLKGQN